MAGSTVSAASSALLPRPSGGRAAADSAAPDAPGMPIANDLAAADNPALQRARLRLFLRADLPFDVAFGVVLLILNANYPSLVLFTLAIACFINAIFLVWAYWQVQRGSLEWAITAIASGILGIITCAAFLAPRAFPVLALITVLPVAVALPFLSGFALLRLMGFTMVFACLIAAFGLRSDPFDIAMIPEWVIYIVLGVLTPAITGLILLLLWLYSSRLTQALHDMRAANLALREREAREIEQARVQQDLARAREIQERLVPPPSGGWPGKLEIAARLRPARETSGDFYDLFELTTGDTTRQVARGSEGPGKEAAAGSGEVPPVPIQIAIGDVQGKGIGAALVMALAQATLRTAAYECLCRPVTLAMPVGTRASGTGSAGGPVHPPNGPLDAFSYLPSPASTLTHAGSLMHRGVGMKDFVACALAVVEPHQDRTPALLPAGDSAAADRQATAGGPGLPAPVARLRLANAAQVPPLLCRGGQAVELVPTGEHLPLGVLAAPDYDELVVDLFRGDAVIFASDGLPEAPAQEEVVGSYDAGHGMKIDPPATPGELFSFERMTAAASFWSTLAPDAQGIVDGLWETIVAWCGDESHHDDMTLLVLRIPDKPAGADEKIVACVRHDDEPKKEPFG